MKKLFACTAALALLTGACFALPASAEETTYRPGDVDMDGKLTAMSHSGLLCCIIRRRTISAYESANCSGRL